MAKISSWSGNYTSDLTILDKELDMIADFCKHHESVYIFGKGKIGKAFAHYLNESDLVFSGFITSESLTDFESVYARNKTGIIVGVGDAVLNEVIPSLTKLVAEPDILVLPSHYRELIGNQLSLDSVRENFWITIFITSRCNLGCKSCSTYSPVTSLCKTDTDYSYDVFKRDIKQLREQNLQHYLLKFSGGEALLHPRLFDMFAVARKYFPDTPIECYTNGILLNKLDDRHLHILKDFKIMLIITEYPFNGLDLSEFYIKADRIGINYSVVHGESTRYFTKRPLNFDKNTKKHYFFACPRYKVCHSLTMYQGKLWKCISACNHNVLNEAFNTNFEIVNGDFLDLHNTTPEAIYQFAISRIPFCGYCNPITELVPWALSERKIEEWI